MDADERAHLAHREMSSRFSVSSEETVASSQAGSEEQQASDHPSSLDGEEHNTRQLTIPPNSENEPPKPLARSTILRRPSRRKGLVFMPSTSVTLESAAQASDSPGADDMTSGSSEDFDTNIRPDHNGVESGQFAPLCGEASLVRESKGIVRPLLSSHIPIQTNYTTLSDNCSSYNAPWPVAGQLATEEDSKWAKSTAFVGSQGRSLVDISPTSSIGYSAQALPFGHPMRRKPAPRLENYDNHFPPCHPASTVITGNRTLVEPSPSLPRSVSIDIKPTTSDPKTERDTMRSRFRVPRFGTPNLRESASPLRKIFFPFNNGSRKTLSTPNSRAMSRSPSRPVAGSPFPQLGSPLALCLGPVVSGRTRTSSPPTQATSTPSTALSSDRSYLSPTSLGRNDRHINPTSSAPSFPILMTPGTPDSSTSIQMNTHEFLGLATPSTPGSIPITPTRSETTSFDVAVTPSRLVSGGSSRCSTPVHGSGSARSLRSIANKAISLPTFMRSSSSKTVSDDFSQATTITPYVLRLPWMGDPKFDRISSPGSLLGAPFEYVPDTKSNSSQMLRAAPNSHDSSQSTSPMPPPFFHSKSNLSHASTSSITTLHVTPACVGWGPVSPLGLPVGQPPVGNISVSKPIKVESQLRGRSKPGARMDLTAEDIDAVLASKVRSRSEGASSRHGRGECSVATVKHKGSFRSFPCIAPDPSANESAIYYDSDERKSKTLIVKEPRFGDVGKGENVLKGMRNRAWSTKDNSHPSGQQTQLQATANAAAYIIEHRAMKCALQSNLPENHDSLETEIAMTSRFVELLSAEHAKDYQRIQAMIDEVHADITGVITTPEGGSSDREDSIIESYMQHDADGAIVMDEDGYDSDYSLNSHSGTLRAEDFSVEIPVHDEKSEATLGGEIGHWYGVPGLER